MDPVGVETPRFNGKREKYCVFVNRKDCIFYGPEFGKGIVFFYLEIVQWVEDQCFILNAAP